MKTQAQQAKGEKEQELPISQKVTDEQLIQFFRNNYVTMSDIKSALTFFYSQTRKGNEIEKGIADEGKQKIDEVMKIINKWYFQL
jgi:hypothetical protein